MQILQLLSVVIVAAMLIILVREKHETLDFY